MLSQVFGFVLHTFCRLLLASCWARLHLKNNTCEILGVSKILMAYWLFSNKNVYILATFSLDYQFCNDLRITGEWLVVFAKSCSLTTIFSGISMWEVVRHQFLQSLLLKIYRSLLVFGRHESHWNPSTWQRSLSKKVRLSRESPAVITETEEPAGHQMLVSEGLQFCGILLLIQLQVSYLTHVSRSHPPASSQSYLVVRRSTKTEIQYWRHFTLFKWIPLKTKCNQWQSRLTWHCAWNEPWLESLPRYSLIVIP